MTAIVAYILIVLGVAVWALMVPLGKRLPDALVRGVTVFGGAFLLAVCFLGLLPDAVGAADTTGNASGHPGPLLPCAAVLAGFLVQQLLEALSSHAEHGHIEADHEEAFPVAGLMLGLSLHALLEGMPLVEDGTVNRGLLYGIMIHNIPVALVLTGLFAARGMRFGRILALLVLFGLMTPLGSLFSTHVLQPDAVTRSLITGLVVGVLLHVSSSILFDHKRNHFSWLNLGLMAAAFALAALVTIH